MDRRPNWQIRQEQSIKEYQANEKKLKQSPDNNRDIDMGGGDRNENSTYLDKGFTD